jgi:hypothetical protein
MIKSFCSSTINVHKTTSNGKAFKHEVTGFAGTIYKYHTRSVANVILQTKLAKPRIGD